MPYATLVACVLGSASFEFGNEKEMSSCHSHGVKA